MNIGVLGRLANASEAKENSNENWAVMTKGCSWLS